MSTHGATPSTLVFEFIVAYKAAHDGCSPTVREMVQGLGYKTTSSVAFHLGQLEQSGLIRRSGRHSRAIEVIGGKWIYEAPQAVA